MKLLNVKSQSLCLVFFVQLCLVFSSTAAFALQPLDLPPFNIPSFQSLDATTAWVSQNGPNNIRAEDRTDGHVMVVPCNQTSQIYPDRCHYDHKLVSPQDFSIYKEFAVEIFVPDPEAVNNITLYFESVPEFKGYYAQSIVPKLGWQTLTFSVAQMGMASGDLASASTWSNITKIRLSPWKGSSSQPTELAIRSFRAIPRSSVAVIQDYPSGELYKQTSDILNNAFIKHDIKSVADIENGYLTATQLVILPQTAQLSNSILTKLESFVAAGGRIIALGTIDERLQALLGVSSGNPVASSQVAFQFSDSIITNLPPLVKQVSKPLQVSAGYPAGDTTKHARVIAKWNDVNGPTQYPAWIASDSGLYMSSALLKDTTDFANASNQWKMLLALINQYVPSLAMQASADAFADSVGVGKYSDYATAIAGIRANEPHLSSARVAEVEAELNKVESSHNSIMQQTSAGNYAMAISYAKMLKVDLRNAYNLSQLAGAATEFRGVWSHDGFGPYMTSGGWGKAIPLLRDNGFNAVITNVSGAGFAHYNSNVLPHSANTAVYGDQLALIIKEAHAAGIKVHAWDLVWNLYGTDMQGQWYQDLVSVDPVTGQDRLMGKVVKDSSNNYQVVPASGTKSSDNWISPCNQKNRDFKKAALLEMATKYEVDGIHLDYHRANGDWTLFEDSCRKRFEAEKNLTVTNWPADVIVPGALKTLYNEWRPTVITSFTKEIHDALIPINERKLRLGQPKVVLSGAVFPDPEYARVQNAQDWSDWITKGIIDVLHPMDYTADLAAFHELVRKQNIVIANRIPFYPGIGVVTDMTSDRSIAQVVSTRGDNPSAIATGGFTLYNFGNVFASDYLSVFGNSLTSNRAAQAADLGLAVAINPQQPAIGRPFIYSVTVTNRGPDVSVGETVSIWLPPGLTLNSAIPSSGTCTLGSPIVCVNSSAAVGQISVGLNLTAATVKLYSIDLSVRSNSTDPTSTDNVLNTVIDVKAPDLTSSALSATKQSSTISINHTVKNIGGAVSGAFATTYYLSTDKVFSAATDIPLSATLNGTTPCSRSVTTSLLAGASNSVTNYKCYKPSSAKIATSYYVLSVVDAVNAVLESNEANNTRASSAIVRW